MTGAHRPPSPPPRRWLPWAIGGGCVALVGASLLAMHVGDRIGVEPEAAAVTVPRMNLPRTVAVSFPPAPELDVEPLPSVEPVLPEPTVIAPSHTVARAPLTTATVTKAPERPQERPKPAHPTTLSSKPTPKLTAPTTVSTLPVVPEVVPTTTTAATTTAAPTTSAAPTSAPATTSEPTPTAEPTTEPTVPENDDQVDDLPPTTTPTPTATPQPTEAADETDTEESA